MHVTCCGCSTWDETSGDPRHRRCCLHRHPDVRVPRPIQHRAMMPCYEPGKPARPMGWDTSVDLRMWL
eukprot:9866893-Alexandrium_andersonii.AAC.1